MVLGFSVGLIPAVVASFVINRLEEIHGRRATAGEIGFVIGLILSWFW
jgi:hypothetical protein